ncbi:hypothetical protein ACOSQ2_002646 [Xanthoceras sorbifolium]
MASVKKKSAENGINEEEDGVIHRDVKPEKKMVSSSCTRCWPGSRHSTARLPPKLMNCFLGTGGDQVRIRLKNKEFHQDIIASMNPGTQNLHQNLFAYESMSTQGCTSVPGDTVFNP